MTESEKINPQELNDLRSRIVSGEEVSDDEIASAIQKLRAHRSAGGTTKKNVPKKKPEKMDISDLI